MNTKARIGLGILLILILVFSFIKHSGVGVLLLMILFPLVIMSTKGVVRRGLFLTYIWLVLTIVLRAALMALAESLGRISKDQLSTLISLVSPLAGFLILVGMTVAILLISSEWVLSLRQNLDISRSQAIRSLASLIFGVRYPYQVIEDEQITASSPDNTMSKLGAPGLLVIRPGNAVVLERGAEVSRIVGPGIVQTRPFERVREALDLRPQWATINADDILTRDGIPLHVEARIRYQIEPLTVTQEHRSEKELAGSSDGAIAGTHPVHENSIFKAVYMSGPAGWRKTTTEAVELILRETIGQRTLVEAFSPPDLSNLLVSSIFEPESASNFIADLKDEILNALNIQTREWGVYVTSVNIALLEPPSPSERAPSRTLGS